MHSQKFIVLLLVLFFWLARSEVSARSIEVDSKHFRSPNGRFAITLSQTREKNVYKLTVSDGGRELSHYKFEGELVTASWSPSEEYIAINNHSGHMGWYLWVISLHDGSVVKRGGAVKAANYDRYLDYEYAPNILDAGKDELEKIYPKFRDDSLRVGYVSIAQRWESGNRPLIFHEFGFNKLFVNEKAEIWVQTVFEIGKSGIQVHPISAKKVMGDW